MTVGVAFRGLTGLNVITVDIRSKIHLNGRQMQCALYVRPAGATWAGFAVHAAMMMHRVM